MFMLSFYRDDGSTMIVVVQNWNLDRINQDEVMIHYQWFGCLCMGWLFASLKFLLNKKLFRVYLCGLRMMSTIAWYTYVFLDHPSTYARFCASCLTCEYSDDTRTHDPSKEVGTRCGPFCTPHNGVFSQFEQFHDAMTISLCDIFFGWAHLQYIQLMPMFSNLICGFYHI